MSQDQEHVLGEDGEFHVKDQAVDISIYGWEDWISFALFWMLSFTVFYQVFTRYVLNDSAGWTEEIARYFLVAVVFVGASMSVRKNNHIHVDVLYRIVPRWLGRIMSTLVDAIRILFLGYGTWLTWLLLQRIGNQPMAVIELPVGIVFACMLFGFAVMFGRSIQVAVQNWRHGESVLENPDLGLDPELRATPAETAKP